MQGALRSTVGSSAVAAEQLFAAINVRWNVLSRGATCRVLSEYPTASEGPAATLEFGFKLLAHLMPDLPGSSAAADVVMIDDVLDGSERVRCR